MADSAQTRRDRWSRRVFALPQQVCLGPPRRRSAWLAHVLPMDTLHTFPGLESVLTTSDLAAHLGVPVQSIHDLRHAHRGPHGFRVGREMRYRLYEVQHWVEDLESQDRAVDSVKDARL